MSLRTYRAYPFLGKWPKDGRQFMQHCRLVVCIPPYQRTRRDQPVNLFVVSVLHRVLILRGRTRHPIDQTSIRAPTSTLSSGERWLKITSGARTCSGACMH